MKTVEGALEARGLRFGIVVSRFNEFITGRLLEGAVDALVRHGARKEDITVVRVPGAFEIPVVAKRLCRRDDVDAVICLGTVIRGATPHFDYVAAEVSKGVAMVSLDAEKPVAFGVLTTDTIEQAVERAGSKSGNKGWDAALSAIETTKVLKSLEI